jgi:hypothetical protein
MASKLLRAKRNEKATIIRDYKKTESDVPDQHRFAI